MICLILSCMLAKYKHVMTQRGGQRFEWSWKWSALTWLDNVAHVSLPAELRVFVLLLGWVTPLAIEHNPLSVFWMTKDVWSVRSVRPPCTVSGLDRDDRIAAWGSGLITVGQGFCGLDSQRLFSVALDDRLFSSPPFRDDSGSDGESDSRERFEDDPTKRVATYAGRRLMDALIEHFEWVICEVSARRASGEQLLVQRDGVTV